MLTLRQLDSIVHNTLLTFKGFEIERREEGTNIFYNIYDNHESAKTFLGTYRVGNGTMEAADVGGCRLILMTSMP